MATMAGETTETTENREESGDRPLMVANSAAIGSIVRFLRRKRTWDGPSQLVAF